jgi:hypothetical protein
MPAEPLAYIQISLRMQRQPAWIVSQGPAQTKLYWRTIPKKRANFGACTDSAMVNLGRSAGNRSGDRSGRRWCRVSMAFERVATTSTPQYRASDAYPILHSYTRYCYSVPRNLTYCTALFAELSYRLVSQRRCVCWTATSSAESVIVSPPSLTSI